MILWTSLLVKLPIPDSPLIASEAAPVLQDNILSIWKFADDMYFLHDMLIKFIQFSAGPIIPYGAIPQPDGLQTVRNIGRLPQTLWHNLCGPHYILHSSWKQSPLRTVRSGLDKK